MEFDAYKPSDSLEVEKLKLEIAEKNENISTLRDRVFEESSKIYTIKNSVLDVVKQLFKQEDITKDGATYLLEAIGLEPTEEKEISFTIKGTASMTVSIFDEQPRFSSYDLDAQDLGLFYNGEELDNIDYSVDDASIY